MAAMLPWGSGADRWRLAAGCASAAVLAAFVFPLAAHWIWGGGWLAQLGVNFGLGAGFLDGGGAATVHVLGGLSALAVVWIAGPRTRQVSQRGPLDRHARPQRRLCALRLPAGAGGLAGLERRRRDPLAARAARRAARHGDQHAALGLGGARPPPSPSPASASASPTPASAPTAGWPDWWPQAPAPPSSRRSSRSSSALVAGIFTPLLVELLELALSIDDPSGAITVHAAAGLWGLVAAGLFAPQPGQLLAQLVGIAALLGLVLPLVYLLFALLNRVVPFRVDPDGERIGMDLHELGGGAYPEFVIHRDESYR